MKLNKEEGSTLTALTVDGDYVLDSCSEQDFDDHGCSKFSWWRLTVEPEEVNVLVGQPF